jgi:hypothetical protein
MANNGAEGGKREQILNEWARSNAGSSRTNRKNVFAKAVAP